MDGRIIYHINILDHITSNKDITRNKVLQIKYNFYKKSKIVAKVAQKFLWLMEMRLLKK